MNQIKVTKCQIDGLYIIEPVIYRDERGYFIETYNQKDMHEFGLDMIFVQDNQSMSIRGVIRGMGYQKKYQQGKLIRVISGKIYDVAVDLRKTSPTFGEWFGLELSNENNKQLYISRGFAHGFLTLSDKAEVSFKVTDFYHHGDEAGFIWNDSDVNIRWPIEQGMNLIISERDRDWKRLKETLIL